MDKKINQTELARKLGVSPQYIWKVVHGHKRVSPQRAVEIEIASDGIISRHELLPEVSTLFCRDKQD